jgi:hypothetical protein
MEYFEFSLKKEKKKFKTFERQKHFAARSTFSKPLLGVCPPFLSATVLHRQQPLTAGDATEVDSLCSLPHAHPSLSSKRNNHHFWDSKSCVAAHHHRTPPSQAKPPTNANIHNHRTLPSVSLISQISPILYSHHILRPILSYFAMDNRRRKQAKPKL